MEMTYWPIEGYFQPLALHGAKIYTTFICASQLHVVEIIRGGQ